MERAKKVGVDTWIWLNILILFREIDPPEIFREYGIKQTEFDALSQLFLTDHPLTQTELKRRLLTTKGSVSQMLTRMEEKGMVRRESDREDKRRQMVVLTEKGKVFIEPRIAQHVKRISRFFSTLTELEKEILLKILTKLRKALP